MTFKVGCKVGFGKYFERKENPVMFHGWNQFLSRISPDIHIRIFLSKHKNVNKISYEKVLNKKWQHFYYSWWLNFTCPNEGIFDPSWGVCCCWGGKGLFGRGPISGPWGPWGLKSILGGDPLRGT